MLRRLHGVDFLTRGYATAYAGVCGRDDLTLWYAPYRQIDRNLGTAPLHPYRMTISSHFLVSGDGQATPERRE